MIFRMVYKSGQIFLPFCHNTRVWQTDGRTDGRTDRILIARPRLHSMQRGKNGPFHVWLVCNESPWYIRTGCLNLQEKTHTVSVIGAAYFPF